MTLEDKIEMKSLYYKRDGSPADMKYFVKSFEGDRRVGLTILPNGTRISTVFLCLNHNFGFGKPLIFETMVFPKGSLDELEMVRYCSEEEAIAGHERIVKKWTRTSAKK